MLYLIIIFVVDSLPNSQLIKVSRRVSYGVGYIGLAKCTVGFAVFQPRVGSSRCNSTVSQGTFMFSYVLMCTYLFSSSLLLVLSISIARSWSICNINTERRICSTAVGWVTFLCGFGSYWLPWFLWSIMWLNPSSAHTDFYPVFAECKGVGNANRADSLRNWVDIPFLWKWLLNVFDIFSLKYFHSLLSVIIFAVQWYTRSLCNMYIFNFNVIFCWTLYALM